MNMKKRKKKMIYKHKKTIKMTNSSMKIQRINYIVIKKNDSPTNGTK